MKAPQWTTEKIKSGFERFNSEYGRLPSATEVDSTPYLPSSRWIQIKYGGLEKLRIALGFKDSHFGKGVFRSQIAYRVNRRGRATELELEENLKNIFGEVFVHTERIFGERKYRVDFYVYSPDGNFGIDIFYPDNMRTLQSSVNIKNNKYLSFQEDLFLVVANESISQVQIDAYVLSKTRVLPMNIKLVSLRMLYSIVKSRQAYPNPLKIGQ